MSKRIFLTGAAGFIGFHLAQALVARGDTVVGFDNFNPYYSPTLKRARAQLLRGLGVEIVEGSLCDFAMLQRAVEKFGPTHLVHLAAQAGVRHSLDHPQAYVKANLEGFVNILEICRQMPAAPLIYASSSSVYGRNQKMPFLENDRTDEPASLYGATKKANEVMASAYHHLFNIPVTGLRFFTVYGPWGRPDMAYYSFTDAIVNDKPIDIYNFGNMLRDFTYIDDIVKGTVAAIDLGSACELFNLGNHRPVSLGRFIEILEQTLGKKAIKIDRAMQAGDVVATYADITHAQNCLGFYPSTSLEEGLPKFVSWYRDWVQTCDSGGPRP